MDDEEAIAADNGADIARAFPGEAFDNRVTVRLRDTSGEKMGERAAFFDGMGEFGFQVRDGTRRTAGERFDRGAHKELEGNHRRDRIARQAEDRFAFAPAEDGGLPWAQRNGVEEKFRSLRTEDFFDEVVLPY